MTIPKAPGYSMPLKKALVFAGMLDAAKAGRGKPSKEMLDNATILVRDHGYMIANFSLSVDTKSTDKAGTITKKIKVEHSAIKNAKPEIGEIVLTYPEADYEAFAMVNGKKVPVGMRECCSNCYRLTGQHVSLTGHGCQTPSVSTVDLRSTEPTPVQIVPRKTPLKRILK